MKQNTTFPFHTGRYYDKVAHKISETALCILAVYNWGGKMTNLIGWIIAGMAFGFYRAWKKTSIGYASALQTLNETPNLDKAAKARAVGYSRGLRLVPLAFYSVVGGIVGAVIWLVFSTLSRF